MSITSSRSSRLTSSRFADYLRFKYLWKAALALLVLVFAWRFLLAGEAAGPSGTTFEVQRGALPITIVEGGEAISLEPHRVKCEVKGRDIKILSIVEEGYRVTREDIENRKVLVQLDTSELETRMLQQRIDYASAKASLSKAMQDLEIQEQENASTIQAAERDAKFMAMDLRKYLGEALANELILELTLRREAHAAGRHVQELLMMEQEVTEPVTSGVPRPPMAEAPRPQVARGGPEQGGEGGPSRGRGRGQRGEGPPEGRTEGGEGRLEQREGVTSGEEPVKMSRMLRFEGEAPAKQDPDRDKAAEKPPETARTPASTDPQALARMNEDLAAAIAAYREKTEEAWKVIIEHAEAAAQRASDAAEQAGKDLAERKAALDDALAKPSGEVTALMLAELESELKRAERRFEKTKSRREQLAESLQAKREGVAAAREALSGEHPETYRVDFGAFEFVHLSDDPRLGGEAAQRNDELQAEILLEDESRMTAQDKLDGTRKLYERGFVTENELKADEMAVHRLEISVSSKQTSADLFREYEFPKQAEEFFSQYEEAMRQVDRVKKEAETKIENAQVAVEAARSRFDLQENSVKDMEEQLKNSTIYAESEGLVTYGEPGRRRYGEQIAEGATVQSQMTILTIPDITKMGVTVQVHESAIKKVTEGQPATVTVEAFPENVLHGEVKNVAVMPDSERRWMNPDIKTYSVTVGIEGVHDWLRPGMTADVEIFIKQLEDILFVPLQAVTSRGEQYFVYLENGEEQPVQVGEFNDRYIEIVSGLEEGDQIMLRPLEPDVESGAPEEGEQEEAPEEEPEAQVVYLNGERVEAPWLVRS